MSRTLRRVLTVAACALASAGPVLAQRTAAVGDTPSYRFHSQPFQGGGIQSLEDLRGRPVLVDFWGTRCGPCVNFAVPSALKLAEEYGDDLVVLFVEVQGTETDDVTKFALQKKWFGVDAMWTTERPFSLGLQGIPHSALISPEGEIVVAGYTTEIHGELEEKIEELVERGKDGPEGSPKALKKAWREFAGGGYAKALAAARELAAESGDADGELASAAVAELERRLDRMLARVAWQVENGFLVDALERLGKLERGLKGEAELLARVTELGEKARANPDEIDAAEALHKVEKKLYEDGPDAKYEKALRKLASKYEGTKTAARATRLADLVAAAA